MRFAWALFIALAPLPATAADMAVSFSWSGIPACSGTSPAFRIANAPKGTVRLKLEMIDANVPMYRHGGSTVDYDGKGAVPRGAVNYTGPCPPPLAKHRYVWTVTALDAAGTPLGQAKAEGMFPP